MAKNKQKNDDRPEKKTESAKSNLPLILGGAGCGGLLLVGCLASACIGIWAYSKSDPSKDGVVQTKDKDGKTAKTTDKDSKASYLKKDYDAIKMGDSSASVDKRRGGKGNFGMQWIPKVAEPGVDAKIAKELADRGIKEIWSNQDPAARDVLAIGYQNDRVVFKGYYYGTGGDVGVVYEFTKK